MSKFVYTDQKLIQLWSKVGSSSRFIIENGDLSIYLTKTNLNQETIVFEFNQIFHDSLKESLGFSIEKVIHSNKSILKIGNKNEQSKFADMFFLFIADLLNLSNDSRDLPILKRHSLIVMRIKAWQKFMKSENDKFTNEQEIGLFGELLVLDFLIDKRVIQGSITNIWQGPIRAKRDFSISKELSLEVKTSLTDSPFIAKISSLEQLNNCDVEKLYLVAVKLQESREGQTVSDLIKIIKEKLNDQYLIYEFDSLLVVSGFLENKISRPLMKLSLDYIKAFNVDSIPRILPTTIKGIVRARYEIKLIDSTDSETNYPCLELEAIFD